jgi:2-polyprenyl-6-methoxyphenol hydroxylase-like FAD-dependent oxidoreductase
MTTIGIVGAGIAGLHLALHLQKHGVGVTLYADRTPDQVRASRLPNTVALSPATRGRDRDLGTDDWADPERGMFIFNIRIAGEPPLSFRGDSPRAFLFIDMRLYLPRLMERFASRGGEIAISAPGPADLAGLAASHDLLVVSTGRAGLTDLFRRIPECSPYDQPQRRVFAGLFRGIEMPRPFALGFNIIPGHGEIFENQFLTHGGYVNGILLEAIPGGALEPVTRIRYEDDPAAFNATVLAVLRDHAPATYARTDPAAFALTGPLDTLSGAVLPVVREGVAPLGGGRFALAVGDAHITNDPILGQGANAASRAARLLGDLLVEHARGGGPLDEAFCRRAEATLREDARPVTEWTNAFLQPPPPHAIGLLVAAAQNKAIADAFVTNFNEPAVQWEILREPARTASFVASFGEAAPTA